MQGRTPPESTRPTAQLAPDDVVAGRYRVEEQLGEGGMGVVYRAVDLELEEELAIKLLKPSAGDDSRVLARFKQEIRLARRIHHYNVCNLYDFGSWGEVKFVTMELVRGRSLAALMQDPEELDLDQALTLFHGILDGLEAAHELDIVHRDVKPQNVMVDTDGRPVVMDFGLARELDGAGLTIAGQVLGTPEYMAPERLLGNEIDPRCDVYSLGVILFELATGRPPFTGESIFEIARKQIHEPPPRPTELNAEVPPWLEKVILDMLAKQPEDRIQSVSEVRSRLLSQADEAVSSRAGETPALPASPTAGESTVAGSKVLLIDDDVDFLRLAELYLGRAGIEVLTAETGSEGMKRMLEGDGADLVCLAFHLPDMDGFHVADYLRRLDRVPPVPIFMVSAIPDPQYEKQALRNGIERFFPKPVDLESFVGAVLARLGASLPDPPDSRPRPSPDGGGMPAPPRRKKSSRRRGLPAAAPRAQPIVHGRRLVFAVGS
ncbi:MAG: protein kinase [Thermoanaerobaculia bacterium]